MVDAAPRLGQERGNMTVATHADLANALRALSMDAVQKANSGHPGMPMGMADVATVLFGKHLRFDPTTPNWPDRDRFVLSAGHGSMLLYSLLHLTGYEDMTLEELKRFRQLNSRTAGHPEYGHAAGIETTTGPLGQGLANAVGMAIAERHLAARFGASLVDHHTYVIAGDGCLMEGVSHEAIGLAGHLGLSRLIVLFDDNHISIDGPTELAVTEDTLARFTAAGWWTTACDGHDPAAIDAAITAAKEADQPCLIACRTTIGYGAPTKANTASAHGSPLGEEEIAGTREKLGWPHAPFEIPTSVRQGWSEIGARGRAQREAWEARRDELDTPLKTEWDRISAGSLPDALATTVAAAKAEWLEACPKKATRASSGDALNVLTAALPEMIGGSADLSGSNKTRAAEMPLLTAKDYGGRYLHYGVREHGMAAAMNGMALHGGVIPYGGTFLVFTDYCRPAIRLAALMHQRSIFVMTHDSIGLGEDGPTHQPVEHLAALRAIPGLLVLRPADAVETLECWEIAVGHQGPSVLALTRQGVPAVRRGGEDPAENQAARGAYLLAGGSERAVTLLATGSEVSIALDARALLSEQGIEAAVVSMPSWELFGRQDAEYRAAVLGSAPRVSIEAGVTLGWERWVGETGRTIGIDSFGASAPAKVLYEHFGLTAARVASEANALL